MLYCSNLIIIRLAELSEREANIHNSFISLEKERKEQVRLEAEWTIQYDKLSVKQRDLSQEKEELDKRDKKLQEKEKWIKLQEKNLRVFCVYFIIDLNFRS